MSDDEPSAPSSSTQGRVISSYVLVAEYSILFLAAVAILLVVCLRSNTRLRTRLVYFYVITIIISLGTVPNPLVQATKPEMPQLGTKSCKVYLLALTDDIVNFLHPVSTSGDLGTRTLVEFRDH